MNNVKVRISVEKLSGGGFIDDIQLFYAELLMHLHHGVRSSVDH